MAIKSGHEFPHEHGFTGSAHPGRNFKAKIPGHKTGHMVHAEGAKEHHGKKDHKDHDGENHEGGVSYDEHGYQMHKTGHMVKGKKGC